MKVVELLSILPAFTTIKTLLAISYVSLVHLKILLVKIMMLIIVVALVFTYCATKEIVKLCSQSSITTENA